MSAGRYFLHFPERRQRTADLEVAAPAQALQILPAIAAAIAPAVSVRAILVDRHVGRFAEIQVDRGRTWPATQDGLAWSERPRVVHGTDAELATLLAADPAALEIVIGAGVGPLTSSTVATWRDGDPPRNFAGVTVLTTMTPARVLELYTGALGWVSALRLFACPPAFLTAAAALQEIAQFEAELAGVPADATRH